MNPIVLMYIFFQRDEWAVYILNAFVNLKVNKDEPWDFSTVVGSELPRIFG